MFHKLVLQHMQDVMGPRITTLLQIYYRKQNVPVKEFWRSVKIWQNYGHKFSVQFLAHPVSK